MSSGQNVQEVNPAAKPKNQGGEKITAVSKTPPTDRTADDGAARKTSQASNLESSNLPASWGPSWAETFQKAQQGDADALMAIGNRYQYDQDHANALVWFRKAADAGSTWGMTSIGAAYEYGQGVETDYRQAANWYRRAADRGSRDGMYYLGILYENGHGVPQDQQPRLIGIASRQSLGWEMPNGH